MEGLEPFAILSTSPAVENQSREDASSNASSKPCPLPVIAIVIPCYNEQNALPNTLDAILAILDRLSDEKRISRSSYIACVDDGSRDSTWDIISKRCSDTNGRVKGLRLTHNFGHQNALIAGLMSFEYDAAITIDADRQDPPEVIADMVSKYAEGYDIVYGVRSNRSSDSYFKRKPAQLYYQVMQAMHVNIVYDHADFRLLSRRVIDKLSEFGEYHLFMRGIIPYIGYTSSMVYYNRTKRLEGVSHYPLRKQMALAWDGITSFSTYPLTLISSFGAGVVVIGFALLVSAAVVHIIGRVLPGWYIPLTVQLLLSGINFVFLGIMGQYVGRIYQEVKKRPRFIVETKLLKPEQAKNTGEKQDVPCSISVHRP